MVRKRKKKCLNCGRWFYPDSRRNGHESPHKYCGRSECRGKSNRVSSHRWRTKKKDNAEFRKKECRRSKKSREANPGCRRRQRLKKKRKKISETRVVRDLISEEFDAVKIVVRDLINRQELINKGLISIQFDVVRDEIDPLVNQLYDRGKELSGMRSESEKSLTNKEGNHHGFQKVNLPGTPPPGT